MIIVRVSGKPWKVKHPTKTVKIYYPYTEPMLVSIFVQIYPSEDPEKVMTAVMNIFPDAMLETTEKKIHGFSPNLDRFGERIRQQKILDSARSTMIKGQRGDDKIIINLNKQVAFANKISFTEERTILGSIKVTIEDDDILGLIDRTAPKTVDGEEV